MILLKRWLLKINKIKLNITKEYVLNGQFPDKELRYSERSVNEVLKQLGEKAGIKKRIYAHLIRHCFATHSVENGTDINLLQKLLGHSNVKTTNIYLHISHNHISKINSPVNAIRL
jgi:site-specific recombinase XerD